MDVDDAATWENFLKAILLQLVVTRTTAHHHGFDVQIIQSIGHAVEQHAVIGGDFLCFFHIARAFLRITTAQIAWRQHGLHAHMPKHGLRGQTHLAEQTLRTTAREVEHCLRVFVQLWIANDRHGFVVFDVEQGTRGFNRHVAWQGSIDEMHHLLLYCWLLRGGVWLFLLLLQFAEAEFFGHVISGVLRLKAHVHHAHTQGFHRGRVFGIQEGHTDCRRWVEFLFALFAQEVAHVHSDVTKVDVHRTRFFTAVTHGTVVGHIVEFFKMLERHAATGLFFVQKRFGEQTHTQNLVARAVQQIRTRHMGGTHRLTLTTAQTVFHRMGNLTDVRLLHNQGFHAEQFKRRRVSHAQIGTAHQFAAVKAACRIDLGFVIPKRLHFFVG